MDGSWKDITIGALIAQAIGAGWLYLRSIGHKVSKEEHEKALTAQKNDFDKQISDLKNELGKTNDELKSFARQGAVDEVKSDIRRLETKLEAKLDTIQQ